MARTQSIAIFLIVSWLGLTGCGRSGGPPPIRVGSKNFTEQVVLGELIAQHLERRLGRPVERRLNLGGTLLAHQALLSRQIDLYPEYTGTALGAVLKLPLTNDPQEVLRRVRDEYQKLGPIAWLTPLGINNGFAMVVRATAPATTLTDAAAAAEPWVLGAGYEFELRPDGLKGLEKAYPLRWASRPKSMDLGLLFQALEQGQVTMIAANATDGLLVKSEWKVLADDRRAFPPYELCIAAREDSMRETPGLRAALEELSGRLTNQTMQRLNYQVDVEHQPVATVAAQFLAAAQLR